VVFSVGYAGFATNTELAARLAASQVAVLVDVRALASSRRRGFSRTALAEALAGAGVEYVHMRELGNPREGRELYRAGRIAEGRAFFERRLRVEGAAALTALAALVLDRRCALMCRERDPADCHRTVIVEALARSLGEVRVVEVTA
jgi:uncharacterized protein (DUF488 family)